MFGNSRPVVFNPYKKRRSIWRLPRWLVLLLVGIILGAAGVITVQQRYLPPRLSAEASERLTRALEMSDNERLRLAGELGKVTTQLESSVTDACAMTWPPSSPRCRPTRGPARWKCAQGASRPRTACWITASCSRASARRASRCRA
jgi:hypothetical protein